VRPHAAHPSVGGITITAVAAEASVYVILTALGWFGIG
jgi:hypothetical protein